ncbi:hypothetical protein C9I98_02065 [Photobacterium sanctipauli]|uniref:Diguanylate phosphodiesterase n=1 Tax=Photobacterium sanctipauli TaxID=1342794 RepID=A0A2T3P0M4_9GAMM|nr:EAL domain-containing protein [Photobacterium sanctipauli]PSW22073.1 hypothetical protein C9I98_02065 [Photobacterium sanctipauli]
MKTLIVEDDLIQASKLKIDLRELGVSQIAIASTYAGALELSQQSRFDIIFCDINLPDSDGIHLLAQLSPLCGQAHIVILSGCDNAVLSLTEKVAQVLGFKSVHRIDKPYDNAQLSSLLSSLNQAKLMTKADNNKKWPQPSITHSDFITAIEQQQLVNFYQPQVNTRTGETLGIEALVRWIHPDAGLLLPNQFLEFASDQHTSVSLFKAVLKSALRAMQQLPNNLQLSVNLTSQDLAYPSFYDDIVLICDKYGFNYQRLTLELNEKQLYLSESSALVCLARFKLIGVKLAIDDIGCGYSSLSRLTQIPFDEVKIDKSLVQGVSKHSHQQAITQLLINLSQQLNLKCVVEGVEDEDDLQYLQHQGANLFQGYLTGKPMPTDELAAYLNTPIKPVNQPVHSCLIVDDHPIVCIALKQAFNQHPDVIRAISVETANEAMSAIRAEHFSLLIVDINLKSESGFSLIERAKEQGFQGKIIAMSSSENPSYPMLSDHKGADGFINKTLEVDQIVQTAINLSKQTGEQSNTKSAGSHCNDDPFKALSQRELEVLDHLINGQNNKSIAALLSINEKTVSTYKTRILQKLNASSVIELSKKYSLR